MQDALTGTSVKGGATAVTGVNDGNNSKNAVLIQQPRIYLLHAYRITRDDVRRQPRPAAIEYLRLGQSPPRMLCTKYQS